MECIYTVYMYGMMQGFIWMKHELFGLLHSGYWSEWTENFKIDATTVTVSNNLVLLLQYFAD